MQKFLNTAIVATLSLLVAACSTSGQESVTQAAAPTVDQQALLLQPGQNVLLIIEEGAGSQRQGSQGLGRFVHNYRGPGQRFGPAPIVEHTPTSLTFRTRTTNCTIRDGGLLTCENGAAGRWEITDLPIPGA
ncbi:MAG: hypothetical protein RIB53_00425 [Roseitalea porphyridii]|jgi:hypothetical protein|uniref:hypothetical protein n=1 Tax=Roseitalea porphyridii TaxID=1852022 RepID=UPI0032ECB20D